VLPVQLLAVQPVLLLGQPQVVQQVQLPLQQPHLRLHLQLLPHQHRQAVQAQLLLPVHLVPVLPAAVVVLALKQKQKLKQKLNQNPVLKSKSESKSEESKSESKSEEKSDRKEGREKRRKEKV